MDASSSRNLLPHQWQVLKPYLQRLRFYRSTVTISVGLGVGTVLLGLAAPFLTKEIVDRTLLGGGDLVLFFGLSAGTAAVLLMGVGGNALQQWVNQRLLARIRLDLRRATFRHLLGLDLEALDRMSASRSLYRIGYDVDQVTQFIAATPVRLAGLGLRLVVTLAVVAYLNVWMGLWTLIVGAVVYLPTARLIRRIREVFKTWLEQSEAFHRRMQEVLSNLLLIKALGTERWERRRQVSQLVAGTRAMLHTVSWGAMHSLLVGTTPRVVVGLSAAYGGYLVIQGSMTLGSLTAVMIYLRQLAGLQSEIAHLAPETAMAAISCERLTDIWEAQPRVVERPHALAASLCHGEVVFDRVTFGYRHEVPVLREISFRIPAGTHVAIAGPSGCGKTTILNLLLRLYDPWSGEIRVDDHPITVLQMETIRSRIGVALQAPMLWNDTIAENIRYGAPHASQRDVVDVARLCSVDEWVSRLPHGYDTVVGERGERLSMGQRQRIAIARALIKRPAILLLDEAMASIEMEQERRIIESIRGAYPAMTLIVISHRLSSALQAERVYYLQAPDRMIVGVAERLLQTDTSFQRLFQPQESEATVTTVN